MNMMIWIELFTSKRKRKKRNLSIYDLIWFYLFFLSLFFYFLLSPPPIVYSSCYTFDSWISASRYPVFILVSFPPFLLFLGTSHFSARFVSPSRVVAPSLMCFPVLYFTLASSLSSFSPCSFLLCIFHRNIFSRNVRVHLLLS